MKHPDLLLKRKDSKNVLLTLHDMLSNAQECISSLENAFLYNKPTFLKDCRVRALNIKIDKAELIKASTDVAADNPSFNVYVSIPDHVVKIKENIDKLFELVDKKIRENILFSDKAVRETTFLFERLQEILRPTSDIILARNTFLSMYVQESQIGLAKMATEYATLHEERLIEGVCIPAASVLYVPLLESVRNIAWHAKEIAVKLAGL